MNPQPPAPQLFSMATINMMVVIILFLQGALI